jgi:S-adenosylmethionine:tRNA ribosyltransferase-isomerase
VDLTLFDFDLPDASIAQEPAPERDASRLLVLPRRASLETLPAALEHRSFKDLPSLLRAGDLLVLNETAVFPARLLGKRAKTGGKAEVLLLSPLTENRWEALVKTKGTLVPGEAIDVSSTEGGAALVFEGWLGEGRARVAFPEGTDPFEVAARVGHVPLPPYVRRDADSAADRARYQTVYAREPGAVAAPTAGLHFTKAIFEALEQRGVLTARLVLHVGLGTFQPVRVERVEEHKMHSERYAIPDATREALAAARREGRRIVACGTTTVRALESFAASGAAQGSTEIFIYPPRDFALVDALITNFHLPRSTLLMLVSAFAGRERVLAAYREAIARGYRFYSYGDAMLIA